MIQQDNYTIKLQLLRKVNVRLDSIFFALQEALKYEKSIQYKSRKKDRNARMKVLQNYK